MQVRDIMTEHVECSKPTDTLAHAAERMADLDIGSLPVCDENGRLVGIITDRDITVRGTASGCDPESTLVDVIMTCEILFCFEDDDLSKAADQMEENQVRRLVVLSRDKRLVGIVSLGDLALKGGDRSLSAEALEEISEPLTPTK